MKAIEESNLNTSDKWSTSQKIDALIRKNLISFENFNPDNYPPKSEEWINLILTIILVAIELPAIVDHHQSENDEPDLVAECFSQNQNPFGPTFSSQVWSYADGGDICGFLGGLYYSNVCNGDGTGGDLLSCLLNIWGCFTPC